MEFISCQTLKFTKVTTNDLFELNQKNIQNWMILCLRHDPQVFDESNIPICLQLNHKDRIVAEVCQDAHVDSFINFEFVYDVTSLVEEFMIALLLSKSTIIPDTTIRQMQLKIYQGVINPITQVYFTQPELDFFVKVYAESESKKSMFSQSMSYIRNVSNFITSPIIQSLIPEEAVCAAHIISRAAYWTQFSNSEMTRAENFTRIDDLAFALQDSIAILENEDENTILKIWRRLDLGPISNKISLARELSHETIKSLQIFFQVLIEMIPLLGTVVNDFFLNHLANIFIDLPNLGCVDTVLGVMFKYILPLKSGYMTNARSESFVPLEFVQHQLVSTMRINVWNKMKELETKDQLDYLARVAFREHFLEYLKDNIAHLPDDYFNTCMIFDIDCVSVKFRKFIRKPVLEVSRSGKYILYRPLL
jgi:hypothetical protein